MDSDIETPEGHLERKLGHTAANRGLNRPLGGRIPPSAWPFLKAFISLVYFAICIVPGLFIVYGGVSLLFRIELAVPHQKLIAAVIILVGIGTTAIGTGLLYFISKEK